MLNLYLDFEKKTSTTTKSFRYFFDGYLWQILKYTSNKWYHDDSKLLLGNHIYYFESLLLSYRMQYIYDFATKQNRNLELLWHESPHNFKTIITILAILHLHFIYLFTNLWPVTENWYYLLDSYTRLTIITHILRQQCFPCFNNAYTIPAHFTIVHPPLFRRNIVPDG